MTLLVSSDTLAPICDEGITLAAEIKELAVLDQDSFSLAGAYLLAVKEYRKKVAEIMDPVIKAAHQLHKTAMDQKKRLEEPALKAEGVLKGRMATYEAECRRRSLEAEDAARQEQARRSEEAQLQAALQAEANGDGLGAQAILEAPPPILFTPPPQVETPRAEGISFRDRYFVEVEDLRALAGAVAAGTVPVEAVLPNLVWLNGMARQLREQCRIPGVRIKRERIAVART